MNKDYYCEFKKQCIKDNCDCMYEEWHKMSEENIKLCNRIDKAIDYINKHIEYGLELGKILHDEDDELRNNVFFDISEVDEILNILKGSDSNE